MESESIANEKIDFKNSNFALIASKKDLLMQSLINFFFFFLNLDQIIPIIM